MCHGAVCPWDAVAKFVSYIVGAFAAVAIACALIDDRLLHAEVFGRDLLWFTAIMGTVLAASRRGRGGGSRCYTRCMDLAQPTSPHQPVGSKGRKLCPCRSFLN